MLAPILLLLPMLSWAAPRIGVLTVGPGAEYWSRFGHNAIVVVPEQGPALAYNFGYFDFAQPNFLLRFLQGRMLYKLAVDRLESDLDLYAAEGRSARLQWLRLQPQQATALAAQLAFTALPEHADYRYDYFLANCSTRVRDALDAALAGALRQQSQTRSRGLSYRSEALRLGAEVSWMYYGMHLLLGPAADRPITRWEEAFVPAHLADLLEDVKATDGSALLDEHLELLPQRLADNQAVTPRFRLLAFLLGLAAAVGALIHARQPTRLGRLTRVGLATYWLLGGICALVMLLLWFATDHSMAGANRNLLLLTPWLPVLLPALSRLAAGRPVSPLTQALAWLGVCCLIGACALLFLSRRDQDNLEWVLLFGPIQLLTPWLLQPDRPLPPEAAAT